MLFSANRLLLLIRNNGGSWLMAFPDAHLKQHRSRVVRHLAEVTKCCFHSSSVFAYITSQTCSFTQSLRH